MAAGDPVIETGTTSGGGTTTITVPSGETWIISAFASPGKNLSLGFNDGSNAEDINDATTTSPMAGMNDMRTVFDDSVDPRINNNACSSVPHYISGREL